MAVLDKILRAGEGRAIRNLEKIAEEVNSWESKVVALSDEELRAQTQKFRDRYAAGEDLNALLPEVFATVRQAAMRTLGQRHYDVQIMGSHFSPEPPSRPSPPWYQR